PEEARKKIMRATTDSNPAVDFETMGPGVQNLLGIFQAFTDWSQPEMHRHFTGMRYGDLKKQVAEAVLAGLAPIQQRYCELMQDPGYLENILQEGRDRVTPTAAGIVRTAKERMGLYTIDQ
ncbi:MAG: tryptophan--tRNA ligase, partial [Acidobacteriota bacterium]